MNTHLSPSLIQSHRQCPKRAWLEFHGGVEPQASIGAQAILEQGQVVHASARTCFAGVTRIRPDMVLADAAVQTRTELAALAGASTGATLLGGAFVSESLGVGLRVDALERTTGGWRLVCFKSGSTIKDEYLDDCAIDLACLQDAGVVVTDVCIMHPDTARVRPVGGTGAEVFTRESVLDAVYWQSHQVVRWVKSCQESLSGAVPCVEPGEQCKTPHECPFASYCGKPAQNTDVDQVQFLPSKAGVVKELIASGISRISDMPFGAMKHERNALVREAIVQNRAIIRADIADQIRNLPYPRFFVDFEAAGFAIPRFDGMRPYQALPFQWSTHKSGRPGHLEHSEFLDVSGNDPRRGFTESLLSVLGTSGPVLVYSSYEQTRLKELALEFSDLKDAILAVVDRLVDLLKLARLGYYHPDMRGSWSLKKIAPTLPPCAELESYEDMDDVADGMAAQAAYMMQIDPNCIGPQKEAQKIKMLRYCKADTRGLVHFVECMQGAIEPVCAARPEMLEAV